MFVYVMWVDGWVSEAARVWVCVGMSVRWLGGWVGECDCAAQMCV